MDQETLDLLYQNPKSIWDQKPQIVIEMMNHLGLSWEMPKCECMKCLMWACEDIVTEVNRRNRSK